MGLTIKHWKSDLPAGLVVFLVALPLCLGVALASGAPLFAGIIAGVVGGVVASLLSGSHVSVSGPAAGLVAIVAGAITSLGSFEKFQAALLIAGGFQILFGILRIGTIAHYVPHSVIKGMLCGIGIVIILKQIPHAVGQDRDFEGDLQFIERFGDNTFTNLMKAIVAASPGAVMISLIGLVILAMWDKKPLKQMAWTKLLPGALVAVVIGVLLNQIFKSAVPAFAMTEAQHLVTLPVFKGFGDLTSAFTFPSFAGMNSQTWTVGLTLALVASLETLLSVDAADRIDPYRRSTPPNRELLAQGVANATCGFIGGIPVTSVVVRTSANVFAGSRTKLSAIFHGLLLLVAVVAIPSLLNMIPLACLAAVLLSVGYKLAKPALFKEMWRGGASQFVPFILTVGGVVFIDLLKGVIAGLVVGLFFVLRANQHHAITVVSDENNYLIRFNKDLSFLNKGELVKALADLPNDCSVLINGHNALFIDKDILESIDDFMATAEYRNIHVTVQEVRTKVRSNGISVAKSTPAPLAPETAAH